MRNPVSLTVNSCHHIYISISKGSKKTRIGGNETKRTNLPDVELKHDNKSNKKKSKETPRLML